MKAKMRRHVQPRESAHPRVRIRSAVSSQPRNEEARREIQYFLRAVDTYPARVAEDPHINFEQHLCMIFAAVAFSPRRG